MVTFDESGIVNNDPRAFVRLSTSVHLSGAQKSFVQLSLLMKY